MQMPGRVSNSQDYRFGYNGMEKDKEIKGDGNSYTTEFRQYDPRLGRWLSLDPLMGELSEWSPYVAFENNPVIYNDPMGLKAEGFGDRRKDNGSGGKQPKGAPTDPKQGDLFEDKKGRDWRFSSNKKWERIGATITAYKIDDRGFFEKIKDVGNKVVANFAAFATASVHTVMSNNMGGYKRIRPSGEYSTAQKLGRILGDGVTLAQGALEFVAGNIIRGGGATISASGPGAILGVPIAVVGTGIQAHGATLFSVTTYNMTQDKVNDNNANNQNGGSSASSGSNPPGPGKALKKDLEKVKKGEIDSHDVYQGRENPDWKGAEEFYTPNSPAGSGWRILKQKMPDGTYRYGWSKDHYKTINEF